MLSSLKQFRTSYNFVSGSQILCRLQIVVFGTVYLSDCVAVTLWQLQIVRATQFQIQQSVDGIKTDSAKKRYKKFGTV